MQSPMCFTVAIRCWRTKWVPERRLKWLRPQWKAMISAGMMMKTHGLIKKAMYVVPNHLTEQWASEFLRLYPSANILVTTKKDFETHRRKKFCARIATGDYDAVIIGHSQFERIPISRERQERLIQEQIWEITSGIEEVQASGGERFTVKQLERTRKGLESRLEKLRADSRKDDVVTFGAPLIAA